MKPVVRFVPSEPIVKGRSFYRSEDLMLVYDGAVTSDSGEPTALADLIDDQFGLHRQTPLLLIADTLTLTFSGLPHCLTGVDAYTNRALWQVSPPAGLPTLSGQGMLVGELSSFDGDRSSINVSPRYEIASDEQWVRVVLSGETADFYYTVATKLLVGLKAGSLTDIFLLDVLFL